MGPESMRSLSLSFLLGHTHQLIFAEVRNFTDVLQRLVSKVQNVTQREPRQRKHDLTTANVMVRACAIQENTLYIVF